MKLSGQYNFNHHLDLVRARSELQRTESAKTFESVEPRSLPYASYTASVDRVEMQVPTLAIALAGGQERQAGMNGLEREVGEAKLSPGHIDSDREWRFDSLRDVLNPERSGGGDPARE